MADMSGHENFDLSDVLPIQKPGDLAEGLVENDHALNAAFHAAEHDPILDDPDYDEAEEDEALVTGSPAAPEDDDEELSDEQRRRLKQLQDDDLAAQERDAEEDQDKDARRQDEQDSKAEKMGEKDDDPKASGINNRAMGIKDYGDYFKVNGKGKMSARTGRRCLSEPQLRALVMKCVLEKDWDRVYIYNPRSKEINKALTTQANEYMAEMMKPGGPLYGKRPVGFQSDRMSLEKDADGNTKWEPWVKNNPVEKAHYTYRNWKTGRASTKSFKRADKNARKVARKMGIDNVADRDEHKKQEREAREAEEQTKRSLRDEYGKSAGVPAGDVDGIDPTKPHEDNTAKDGGVTDTAGGSGSGGDTGGSGDTGGTTDDSGADGLSDVGDTAQNTGGGGLPKRGAPKV